ncbi:MAG: hypothetical protein ACOVRK_15975 [Chryseobacterium taeanense]
METCVCMSTKYIGFTGIAGLSLSRWGLLAPRKSINESHQLPLSA